MPFKNRTKRIPIYNLEGNEIGYTIINDTRRRWRAIGVWIIVFTLIVFFAVGKNRQEAQKNNNQTVTLTQLEVSGCNLRAFLISSRGFRLRSYRTHKKNAKHLHGKARQNELVLAAQDLAGARLSHKLADNFAPEGCAKRLGLNKTKKPVREPS